MSVKSQNYKLGMALIFNLSMPKFLKVTDIKQKREIDASK